MNILDNHTTAILSISREEVQEVSEAQADDYYEVEKILQKRKMRGRWHCRIKWKGYSNRFNTWVPIKDVQALDENVRNIKVL